MTQPALSTGRPGKRATLFIGIVAVLSVAIPFLFWHETWFGRPLDDQQISDALNNNKEKPRETQHALIQISERMSRGEPVEKWYPQIAGLADHPMIELRVTVAWLMGQATDNEPFHEKLRDLVRDPNPLVRRNAALSLSRFGDRSGRSELLAMLHPYTVTAEHAGVITNRLKAGDTVDRGTLLARLGVEGEAEPLEIRSPVPGVVQQQLQKDGSVIKPGAEVTLLGPDPGHAYEALRGLYLVGSPDDIESIRPFLSPNEKIPAQVNEQARLTIEHLRGTQ